MSSIDAGRISAETETAVLPVRLNRVPFCGGGFAPKVNPLISWLALALFLGSWQFAASERWVSSTFLPGPLEVGAALKSLIISGELWMHLSASLMRIAAGWSIGTVVGLTVGVAAGLFSITRSIATPAISALYPIPKIALLPLIVLWLGIGDTSRVVVIAAGVFFPTSIATFTAIDGVPRNLIRMAQSFRVPLRSIIFTTLLPGALPGIIAGMRISVAVSLLTVVAAEMIGAHTGIGAFVLLQGNLMRSDMLLAGVFVISILGLTIATGLSALERYLFRWR